MCREKTSPAIRPKVSFHLCLQESYVLTVAHSNKNGFYFPLRKIRGCAKRKAACVCLMHCTVMKRTLAWMNAVRITALVEQNAAGKNPLQQLLT